MSTKSIAFAGALHGWVGHGRLELLTQVLVFGKFLKFEIFAVLGTFLVVFERFWKFWDVLGPIQTCWDLFGHVLMQSDALGRVEWFSDFGKF